MSITMPISTGFYPVITLFFFFFFFFEGGGRSSFCFKYITESKISHNLPNWVCPLSTGLVVVDFTRFEPAVLHGPRESREPVIFSCYIFHVLLLYCVNHRKNHRVGVLPQV